MAFEKQICVIEELGIPKKEFETLIEEAELPYTVAWGRASATTGKTEVLITVKAPVDRELLDKYPNLRVVAVAFTGYDSVDLDYCRQKNIAVYNVPAYATHSVVELTLALTLGLLREIPKAGEIIYSGKWDFAPGIELAGKTVGILGTGKIGLAATKIFKTLGCRVLGWSRTNKKEFKNLGGEYVSDKAALFSSSDIVSIHLPLNKNTEGIVGQAELSVMQETAYLINTARGPIVDERALVAALKNQEIAGAGLDVFAREPINTDSELLRLNNVILTPHIAFKTQEALARRAKVTIGNIADFQKGKSTNRVD